MNIAFIKNSHAGFNASLHPDHPTKCVEIGDAESYDPKDGNTWTVMSLEQYEALKAQTDPVWAALQAANVHVGDVAEISYAKRLADKMKAFFVAKPGVVSVDGKLELEALPEEPK